MKKPIKVGDKIKVCWSASYYNPRPFVSGVRNTVLSLNPNGTPVILGVAGHYTPKSWIRA
jgi:hypothetical protein